MSESARRFIAVPRVDHRWPVLDSDLAVLILPKRLENKGLDRTQAFELAEAMNNAHDPECTEFDDLSPLVEGLV